MTTIEIPADRLDKLSDLVLFSGGHGADDGEMCAMEAVAWLAGEPHSDRPACACPVVSAAVRKLNDRIEDTALRTELLKPVLAKLVGSRAGLDVQIRRAYLAANWAVRVFAPMALDARGFTAQAQALRSLAPVTDRGTAANAAAAAAAYDAYDAAAAATAAYDAAATAAYDAAANAAANAAATAATAAYDAAYNAAAAAAATAATAARKPVYEKAVEMILAMLEVR